MQDAPTASSSKQYYSTFRRPKDFNAAMLKLYLDQAHHLLSAIQSGFDDPEIRVGLSIKILHNTPSGTRFAHSVLEPLIRDIEGMIKDHDYLRSTNNPRFRLRCLKRELELVQRYIDLSDDISLNCAASEMTFVDSMIGDPSVAPVEDADVDADADADDKGNDDERCSIM